MSCDAQPTAWTRPGLFDDDRGDVRMPRAMRDGTVQIPTTWSVLAEAILAGTVPGASESLASMVIGATEVSL